MTRRSILSLLGVAAINPELPAVVAAPTPTPILPKSLLIDPGCSLPVNATGFHFARLFLQTIADGVFSAHRAVGDYVNEYDRSDALYKDPDALETSDSAIIRFHNPFQSGLWGPRQPETIYRLTFLVQYLDGHGYVAASWMGKDNRYWDL
jgi:hypothetical protein